MAVSTLKTTSWGLVGTLASSEFGAGQFKVCLEQLVLGESEESLGRVGHWKEGYLHLSTKHHVDESLGPS